MLKYITICYNAHAYLVHEFLVKSVFYTLELELKLNYITIQYNSSYMIPIHVYINCLYFKKIEIKIKNLKELVKATKLYTVFFIGLFFQ